MYQVHIAVGLGRGQCDSFDSGGGEIVTNDNGGAINIRDTWVIGPTK